MLVEIKAPKVDIGKKQVDQIQRYADVIMESPEFDAVDTQWDLFVVSADVKPEVQRRRESADRPFGMYDNVGNVRVWVFRWSEIITRAREELQLVRQHLVRKKADLNLDYWRKEFPEITQSIKSRQERVLTVHK